MAYKKPIIEITMEQNGWKEFKSEGTLPQSALDYLKPFEDTLFKYPPYGWYKAYYKGTTTDNATEWVLVTPDGGSYKCFAIYMIWWLANGNSRSIARWSAGTLKSGLVSILKGENPERDPNYHT